MTGSPHVPMMPADRVAQIRRWHERAYALAQAESQGGDQTFQYLGRTLLVPPQVMPITRMSHLLGEAVLAEVRADDRVLDMGTGCGVNAILAASAATEVVAVDINPVAVAAAVANARRNQVAERIEIRRSDVFTAVTGRFDLIIFDPPFRWFAPRDLLEAASTDPDYRALTSFFRQVRAHLTDRGRLLVFFGSSGDLDYLQHLIAEQGFTSEVVAQEAMVRDGVKVDYLTYRLTVGPEVG